MRVRPRALRSAMSALGIALALVLVPAVAASAQPAGPPTDFLKRGQTAATNGDGSSGSFTISVVVNGKTAPNCSDSSADPNYVGDGAACTQQWVGIKGTVPGPEDAPVVLSWLDTSQPGGSGISIMRAHPLTPTDVAQAGIPAATADGWFSIPGGTRYFAGIVCMGYGLPNDGVKAPNYAAAFEQGACGTGLPDGADLKGVPRSKFDMGHAGQLAGNSTPNPGEQDDGSIDPLACLTAKLGATDGNPLFIPFYAIQCGFLWAFTPPRTAAAELVNHQTDLWDKTSIGKTVNAVDFYSAFDGDNSCTGIPINFSGLSVPGGPAIPHVSGLLNSCEGSKPDLSGMAGLVKLGLTIAVLVGGAFNLVRMIAQFVRGPSIDEPKWEDTRLF